jgi:hypothetical protein
MHPCRHCAQTVEDDRFRFCPWCSAPQRSKLVEFFAPHPAIPGDATKALRVSRYFESSERPAQIRLSIWHGDEARAAVSITEHEAARLSAFVAPPETARRPLIEQLRETLRL